MAKLEPLYTGDRKVSFWKTVWQFLRKLNIELLYDPEIPLLGIYPKELKAGIQISISTQISIIALFIITKS